MFKYENRDCLEAMKEMPDKFVDLAIVDPPYGINIGKSGNPPTLISTVSNWHENAHRVTDALQRIAVLRRILADGRRVAKVLGLTH